jgi:hypothetical protein
MMEVSINFRMEVFFIISINPLIHRLCYSIVNCISAVTIFFRTCFPLTKLKKVMFGYFILTFEQ